MANIDLHIFIDSSVDPISKKGIGCFLLIDGQLSENPQDDETFKLKYVQLTQTSSTEAELTTFKHVITSLRADFLEDRIIYLYTDCQKLVHLLTEKLYSIEHQYAELYNEILMKIQNLHIIVFKVKGHSKNKISTVEKFFSQVDKGSRRMLRKYRNEDEKV